MDLVLSVSKAMFVSMPVVTSLKKLYTHSALITVSKWGDTCREGHALPSRKGARPSDKIIVCAGGGDGRGSD